MANFSLYVNSKFKPFSYQEMLAPALMATQAHQAIEEAYGDLNTQADAIGSLINETNDPVAAARYKSFETALRDKADSLAKNGLTTSSRKSLLDLRSRYSKDITPIQKAIERRRELADEQRKMIAQNPTLMYQRDLRTLSPDSSLDKFLENPDYDYGASYSGALLTQQVAQAASNLAKELTYYGSGKRLDAFTKTFMQQHGYTRSQVLDAINNPNRAESQPVLNSIVEQAIGASKVKDWGNSNIIDEAYNYARMGLWSAIGQSQVSQYADYGARLAAQEAMQRRLQEEKLKNDNPYGGRVVPVPLRNTEEISKGKVLLDTYIQRGYLKKTSRGLIPTKKAQEELRMDYYYRTHPKEYAKYKNSQMRKVAGEPIASNSIMNSRYSPFADWYNTYIGGYDAKRNVFITPTTRLNKYVGNLNEDTYDTYHTTGYDKQFESEYGRKYLAAALGATSNDPNKQKLKVVDWTRDGYKPTGETLKASDLEGAYIGAIRSTSKGRAGRVVLKNNKTVTVEMPSIFEAAERNSITYSRLANIYSQIGNQKYKPVLDSDGYPVVDKNGNVKYTKQLLTDRDRAIVLDNADKNARMVNLYEGQVFMPGSSSDSQDNPWM